MGQTLVLMRMIDGYNRWFFYKSSYNFSIPENTPSNAEVGLVGTRHWRVQGFESWSCKPVVGGMTNNPYLRASDSHL